MYIYIMEYMAMDDDILLCVEMGCTIPISGNFKTMINHDILGLSARFLDKASLELKLGFTRRVY